MSGQVEQPIDTIPTEISWNELDKSKFFFFSTTTFFATRFVFYPSILVKTRLQIQEGTEYKNTRDAFRKIWQREGIRGFYKGFLPFSCGIVPSQFVYISTFEWTKSFAKGWISTDKQLLGGLIVIGPEQLASLVGGCLSSMAATIASVPIDVISQRLMIQDKENMKYKSGFDGFKKILAQDGIRGLFRGLGASVLTYAPGSALFWFFYSVFKGAANNFSNDTMSYHLISSALCAGSASASGAICTNILDVAKTQLQTQDLSKLPPSQRNFFSILIQLVKREGLWKAWKRGLIPRMISNAPVTSIGVCSYELVKQLSRKDNVNRSEIEAMP